MHGVTITDRDQEGRVLAFDLIDILRALGPAAADAEWTLVGGECVGGPADELMRLADEDVRVPGATLLRLAESITQVIDGEFAGYRPGEAHPWVIIRAVDSSAYDVESYDETVFRQLRERFQNVADSPRGG